MAVSSNFAEDKLTTPVTIHGVDKHGTPLTLLDAMTTHYGPHPSGNVHHFRGLQAIVGTHASGRDHQFTSFRARFRNLDAWKPRIREPTWTAQVTLAASGTLTAYDPSTPGNTEESSLWLGGRELPPFSLRGLGRQFLRPLINFLTLALDTPCVLLALQVQDESPDDAWLDIFSAALHPDDNSSIALQERARWLLQPADLNLRHIGSWLDNVDRLGPSPAVVADLAHVDSIALETHVPLLTTVAEGLHRRLYPSDMRFDEDTAADIQVAAVAAVSSIHPKAAEVVRGLLNYVGEPGYAKRLARLADVVKEAAPGVTGRTGKWKELVSGARNEFAHRIKVDFLADNDIDRYSAVTFSLRWLLTALLLLQAGIEPSVLGARFTSHEAYWRFLADARLWQPKVYGNQ
jgi:hypothetical protein